jgi:hypothetical protein
MNKNITPKIWGPVAWYFFHIISFTFPQEDDEINKKKHLYIEFYNIISNLLPCITCQNHYKKILIAKPLIINNRDDLINWVLDVHNIVNLITGKKKYNLNRLLNLYIVNNRININHKLLIKFLYYIIISSNNQHNKKIYLDKLFKNLMEIFPCGLCKEKIKNLYPYYKNKISKLNELLIILLKNHN